MNPPYFILSVDVEDYFQVEAFASDVSRAEWDRWPSRVVRNTERALDLCDRLGVKATYFVLGWVAEKFPALVREIAERGHELACHSFWHRTVYSLNAESFRQDLRQAQDAIQQASGERVAGFRAPSWSITAQSLWALDVLVEEGFLYDSSIFPIHHDIYGVPGAERFPYDAPTPGGATLLEFPPATVRLLGTNIPVAGGGYLRILPFWYTRWAVKRLAAEPQSTVVVYFHPWELDPEQPRIASRPRSRFRHYTHLGEMESRLERLVQGRPFQPFRDLPQLRAAAVRMAPGA